MTWLRTVIAALREARRRLATQRALARGERLGGLGLLHREGRR